MVWSLRRSNSAPDHRADAAQGDLELVNAWRLRIRHWSPIVSLRVFSNQPSVSSSAAYSLRRVPIAFRYSRLLATGIFKIDALCPEQTRHIQMEL